MELSSKQQFFIDELNAGKNVFLTGKAGTGKTFVVKHAMEVLRATGKKVAAIAPTGVAANNIGGQTIHSMFSIDPYGVATFKTARFMKGEKRRMLDKIEVLFIDEVSMLRPDVLDAINFTLLKNGLPGLHTKQVVFIGDLKQLPNVLNDNTRSVLYQSYDGDLFSNAKVYQKLNVQEIELNEVLRQNDPDFISALNSVREGGKSEYFRQFVGQDQKGIVLAPYNATVEKYNREGLERIEQEQLEFTAKTEGNVKADDFNLETVVRVKHGAKIMYLVNSKDAPLVNGTIGEFIVEKRNEETLYFIKVGEIKYGLTPVKFTKKEYVLNEKLDELELKEIGSIEQYPIKLAYALSIHKSQGLTFDEVTVDLSRPCFAPGQMYVALSRVKTPNGLRIIV